MIRLDHVTCRLAGRTLLDDASLTIPDGARIGLIGRNGAGKTTLFRLISGELAPDSGSLDITRNRRLGQVAQEAPASNIAIRDIVLAADSERAELLAAAEQNQDTEELAHIHARLHDIDAHSAPARAARILAGLGFSEAAQARPASEFSGGWRMRVALAAMLFAEPDILLLDEPTNYLDLEGTLWLEGHLAKYPHTLIIVSHDRDLLNGAVDHIVHLDRTKLTLWTGNYDRFATQLADQRLQNRKLAERQEAERAHLQAFVDRFRASATKARQAQSRLKRLAKLVPVASEAGEQSVAFAFPKPARMLASPLLAMDDVAVGYNETPVLRQVSLRLDADDRIGLLGSNGNGKSTFAKLVCNRLQALNGNLTRAPGLSTGYFAQHQLDELRPEEHVLQHLRRFMPQQSEASVRSRAAQYGFPADKAETPVNALSGGERARFLLNMAAFQAPHLLVLDEPTNHLDMVAREALTAAINEFPGAVILISHDRSLLDACVDRLWLVADGTVRRFDGDLEDYRKLVLANDRPQRRDAPREAPAREEKPASPAPPARQTLAAAQTKLQRLELAIAQGQQRIAAIDALLANPKIYVDEPRKAAELARLRQAASFQLTQTEEDWLRTSEELDALKGSRGR